MPNISSGPCQLELFLAFGSLFRIAMKNGRAIMAPRMFVIVFGRIFLFHGGGLLPGPEVWGQPGLGALA